jgi:hypothetical protein
LARGSYFFFIVDIDIVKTNEIKEVSAIDDAQAEEFANAGF